MIKIVDGKYNYNQTNGINNINLTINDGESVCFVGPNGAGKSTLMKILTGVLPLQAGSYHFDNLLIDQTFLNDLTKVGQLYSQIGFVFQDSDVQLFNMTVEDEIAFGPRHLGLTEKEVMTRVDDMLKLMEIEKLRNRVPYQISGGEKKLVAIASVLAMNPSVIVFDEPFNGLSPRHRKMVKMIINKLHSIGKTIIISSHHFKQISEMVDSAYLFSETGTITGKFDHDDFPELLDKIDYL